MKKETQKLMVGYLELKAQQKELTAKVEEAGDKLMVRMLKENLEEGKDRRGTVSISTRTTTTYSESIVAHLDKIKRMAEDKGQVTYKPTPVLTARLAKVEEDE